MTYRFRVAPRSSVQLAFVFAAFVLLQGCAEPLSVVKEVLRDQNERRTESLVPESQLAVSDDGQVTASGPITEISAKSLDLAGATFAVTGRTSFSSISGRRIASKDLSAGAFVEVDGVVDAAGSFEAVSVKEEHTVLVCHVPKGNPDNAHTISVGGRAMEAHLNHGDYEGECETVEEDSNDDGSSGVGSNDPDDDDAESDDPDEEKVAVCHIPPGNPDRARTLHIGISDLQDHLDHGDYEGECLQ